MDDADSLYLPVKVRRGFEAVCDHIREQLKSGALRPGDRLPSTKEMAEQYGLGRNAAREAIRSLELSGVAEARKGINGGFYVKSVGSSGLTQTVQDMVALSQLTIGHMTEARIEITCTAIRLACLRGTEEQWAAIQSDIDLQMDLFQIGKGTRNSKAVMHFYRLLAEATHNPLVLMLVEALSEAYRELLTQVDPRASKDMIVVRQRILDLLRKRDAAKACKVMTEHLLSVDAYLKSEGTGKLRASGRKAK